jgi:hypothetical protein
MISRRGDRYGRRHGGPAGPRRGMIDDYSRDTGLTFNFTVGPTGQLRDALSSGKPADLPAMRERWLKAGWQPAR